MISMTKFAERMCSNIGKWLLRKSMESAYRDRPDIVGFVIIEIEAIENSTEEAVAFKKSLEQFARETFNRRYDAGATMNAVHEWAKEHAPKTQLSGSQLKALQFQQAYLRRIGAV